jgi:hypothetical protein
MSHQKNDLKKLIDSQGSYGETFFHVNDFMGFGENKFREYLKEVLKDCTEEDCREFKPVCLASIEIKLNMLDDLEGVLFWHPPIENKRVIKGKLLVLSYDDLKIEGVMGDQAPSPKRVLLVG